ALTETAGQGGLPGSPEVRWLIRPAGARGVGYGRALHDLGVVRTADNQLGRAGSSVRRRASLCRFIKAIGVLGHTVGVGLPLTIRVNDLSAPALAGVGGRTRIVRIVRIDRWGPVVRVAGTAVGVGDLTVGPGVAVGIAIRGATVVH